MQFGKFANQIGTEIIYSIFEGKEINEYNLTITSTPGKKLTEQIIEIQEAMLEFLTLHNLQLYNILFQRIFATDISNQAEKLRGISFCPAVSYVQQPPLNGAKISIWIVILQQLNANPIDRKSGENEVVITHNGYSHGIVSHMHVSNHEGSYSQTQAILNRYIGWLKKEKLTLAENCLRTWIFVRDIDNNYNGMVKARNEVFAAEGLTPQTHFIASTGIEGQTQFVSTLVMMDAYSIGGLEPG
ncbi:MAG: hypothetical protein NTY07_14425, partial [Bacteroidia bacterium]|nr:hypothetical protein [Bacteroidia bacterium]